jgi:hypothetical protein
MPAGGAAVSGADPTHLPDSVELCARLREGHPCLGVVYRPQPDVAICGRCGDRAGGAMYRREEADHAQA